MILRLLLVLIRKIIHFIDDLYSRIYVRCTLILNRVSCKNIKSFGRPYITVASTGQLLIGKGCRLNNGTRFNVIGYNNPCIILVAQGAKLTIGSHVGMSQTALICHYEIEIGNYVKIGGGTKIYDSDFHSLIPNDRCTRQSDITNTKKAKVTIGDNVFIGAGVTILKGVTIGENSVVGAGSVVAKDIPSNEIWAGNPARLIRKIEDNE